MKKFTIFLMTFLLMFLALSTFAFETERNDFLNNSIVNLESGEYDTAIDDINKLLESGHVSARAYYYLAEAQNAKYLESEAIVNYKKAIALDSDYIVASIKLADIYRMQGNQELALALLNNLLIRHHDPKIYASIALIYVDKFDFELAKNHYTRALIFAPIDEDDLLAQALAYSYLGKNKQAIECLKEINIQSYNSKTCNIFGLVYLKLNDLEKAKEYFEKSISLNPNQAAPYINLGIIYETQKHYELSLLSFKKAIDIRPSARLYFNIGVNYLKQNNLTEANKFFLKALELNPNFQPAKLLLSK